MPTQRCRCRLVNPDGVPTSEAVGMVGSMCDDTAAPPSGVGVGITYTYDDEELSRIPLI